MDVLSQVRHNLDMAPQGKSNLHVDIAADKSGSFGLYDGFESYRTPTEADYRDLFANGVVVPDANVFLNLYRYNEETRNDLLSVLRGLGDRLWVPRQVMVEFWRNRDRVLQDPRNTEKTIQDLTEQRNNTIAMLHAWISRVGLSQERKSHFDDIVTQAFNSLVEDVRKFTDNNAAEFIRNTNRDQVLAELEIMLKGRVGTALEKIEQQEALQEARRRADAKIPPGYKDIGKTGDGPAGDYLIWCQILKEIRSRPRNILIVTGDAKEDWWRRERGELRGPRPELAEEARNAANVRLFMMRPESLLILAQRILRIKVRDESVEDIERIDQYLSEALRPSLESIRDSWPDILQEMKSRSRVGWLLLSNATITSLDGDVLTLEFPRSGDVKGWASSRYDRTLTAIVKRTLGVELRTDAVAVPHVIAPSLLQDIDETPQVGVSLEIPTEYSDEPPF